MQLFIPVSKTILVSVCALSILTFSSIASADSEAAKSLLKSCVLTHLEEEKRKQNSDANNLLTRCENELNGFMSTVPPGSVAAVLDFFRRDIQAALGRQ